jgi:predicted kinase
VSEALFAERLPALARQLLTAGCLTVVDATFGLRRARRPMEALARELGVPLLILELQTPLELARARIQARQRRGLDPSDADLAVLEQQLLEWEPLEGEERSWALRVPTTAAGDGDGAATAALLLEALAAAEPPAPLAPPPGPPLDS